MGKNCVWVEPAPRRDYCEAGRTAYDLLPALAG